MEPGFNPGARGALERRPIARNLFTSVRSTCTVFVLWQVKLIWNAVYHMPPVHRPLPLSWPPQSLCSLYNSRIRTSNPDNTKKLARYSQTNRL